MSDPNIDLIPPSLDPGAAELAEQQRRIDRHDSWVRRYSIFFSSLLICGIVALAFLAVRQGTEKFLKVRLSEAIFGLVALIIAFNIYTIYQEILVKRLRSQVSEKQRQFYSMRNLAMIDPLTGLYNRRFAEQRLAAEVGRSERKGHPLTMLLLDLRHLQQVNDTHGRPVGDRILVEFATRLNRSIRSSDLAVRLGGTEFLVLLPECTLEQLQRVLGRLSPFEVALRGQQKLPVTFSSAWKQYDLGERPEEFLTRTYQALSDAKHAITHHPESQAV